ncbi:MAG: glycosyltransferase family 4 protein [Bernardetiaceae bacterium]|nr:glycosyltransferase family 4 protein [Bernardetiaceae bacterium]
MKIAIFTPNYAPEMGACAHRVTYMAESFAKDGHKVKVFTHLPHYPQGKVYRGYRYRLFHKSVHKGVEIYRYPTWASHSLKAWQRAVAMLFSVLAMLLCLPTFLRFRPDWVWAQSPPLPIAMLGFGCAKLAKAAFALNISDLWTEVLNVFGVLSNSHLLFKALRKVEIFLYKNADLAIGQSQEICNYIQDYRNKKQSILLYRNGIHTQNFTHLDYKEKTEIYQIIYTGLIGNAQGLLDLCQSLNFSDLGAALHIYGSGGERAALAQYVKHNKHKGIYLHEPVSKKQIPQLLAKHDAVLIPQRKHIIGTVPSKLYEAMAVGLPIFLIGKGEAAQLLKEYPKAYIMEGGDIGQLKMAITNAIKNQVSVKNTDTHIQKFEVTDFYKILIYQLEQLKKL